MVMVQTMSFEAAQEIVDAPTWEAIIEAVLKLPQINSHNLNEELARLLWLSIQHNKKLQELLKELN